VARQIAANSWGGFGDFAWGPMCELKAQEGKKITVRKEKNEEL
jgi:hypothetical protein